MNQSESKITQSVKGAGKLQLYTVQDGSNFRGGRWNPQV